MLEVIIVDNESGDNTEAIVKEAAARAPFPVRYHRKINDGPASSRNRGAQLACGEIVAFTDSDCLPSPGWVVAAAEAFRRPEVGLVCGPIRHLPPADDEPLFVHQINPVEREEGLYPTANVFFRRAVFLELGGFDEARRTYAWGQPVGGDDTEFAWRVKEAGWQSVFAPKALVLHQASAVTPVQYLLNSVQAQIMPSMVARYPSLRRTALYRGYFVHRQAALFYLCLAGIALSRTAPAMLLLSVPWLHSTWPMLRPDAWPPRRWGRGLLRLICYFLSSMILVATLAWSSIRRRTVVL
jgi:glycosyltransferase involved in cell wall biosynthesis